MGAGGVGGYFGARLAKSGEDVSFVARGNHLAAMRTNGLQVNSGNGDVLVKPVKATDTPAEIGPVDLVIVAVKLWSTQQALADAKPLVGTNTAVVSFQNGVVAADAIAEAFGKERALGGVSNIGAVIERPGVIRHTGTMAKLIFGELDNKRSARVEALRDACTAAGIDAEIATAKRTTVKLARPIPVAWIYLTGWAGPDGTINFRHDVYNLDPKPANQFMVDVGRPVRVSAARASGFVLQSDDEPTFRPVSYLDSR